MEAFSGRGIPPQKHFLIGLGIFAVYGVLYLGAQHFPLREPTLVPFTQWDHLVGFNAHWVWVYIAAYPYVPVVFFSLRSRKLVLAYTRSYLILTIGSVYIFALWPTILPRAPYPTDATWAGIALEWLRGMDAPTNCLPSLHVATSLVSSWWIGVQNRLLGILGFIFSALVIWSTLALKQHVVWDAVTGTVAAFLSIAATYYFIRRSNR